MHPRQCSLVFGMFCCCLIVAAIYATRDISGAHLNPAMTAAFTTAGDFPKSDVVPYIVAQVKIFVSLIYACVNILPVF